MLAAIAFCPQPPLLVPPLAAGAAGELDGLRAACAEAVRRLVAAGPDRIVVLGGGLQTARYGSGSSGTLAGFGVPATAALGRSAGPPWTLPPALTVGAWLLSGTAGTAQDGAGPAGTAQAGAGHSVTAQAVSPDADPAAVAAGLTGPGLLGLLVMGDGSACRSEQAPGYVDERAAGFDAAVAAALGAGDAATLRRLDPALGTELLAAGVPAWRVAGHAAADLDLVPELLYDAAPYGVGYFVASWVAR